MRSFISAFRSARPTILLAFAAVTGCSRAKAPERPAGADTLWLLAPDAARDGVRRSDSEASLRARYGDSNVVASAVNVGEGELRPGTILFPKDSTRRLAIIWSDTLRRAGAARVSIDGAPTRWFVTPGVSLGTTLTDLERLNGRPFRLFGMAFDYAGTVDTWEGGRLDSLWRPPPGSRHLVWLRLRPDTAADATLVAQVAGDRLFASSNPAMRRLDPKVYDLIIEPR